MCIIAHGHDSDELERQTCVYKYSHTSYSLKLVILRPSDTFLIAAVDRRDQGKQARQPTHVAVTNRFVMVRNQATNYRNVGLSFRNVVKNNDYGVGFMTESRVSTA